MTFTVNTGENAGGGEQPAVQTYTYKHMGNAPISLAEVLDELAIPGGEGSLSIADVQNATLSETSAMSIQKVEASEGDGTAEDWLLSISEGETGSATLSLTLTDSSTVSIEINWESKIPLTITADSDTKVYDGTALTKDSYTNTALVEGDSIESVTVTVKNVDSGETEDRMNVGSSENVPSAAVIKNAGGEDVTANYDISYVNGTLEVTRPTVTAVESTYDGEEHPLVAPDSPDVLWFKLDDGEYRKGEIPSATNAGTYTVSYRLNEEEEAQSVTATINPQLVTLTANSETMSKTGLEIIVEGYTCNVDNLTFEGVSASGKGTDEGMYDVTARKLYVRRCTFDGCACLKGIAQAGSIFHNIQGGWSNNSTTEVEDCTFSNSFAVGGSGGAVESDALDITIQRCSFTGSYTNKSGGSGGAINTYANNAASTGTYCIMRVIDCSFDNCSAKNGSAMGGAVRCSTHDLILKGCIFKNTQSVTGGAVAMTNSNAKKEEISGCTFENCIATGNGGAVSAPVGTLIVGVENAESEGYQSKYLDADKTPKNGKNNFTDCKANRGGGIDNAKDNAIVTMENVVFTGCAARTNGGGALYTQAKTLSITGYANTFTNCTGNGSGGAVFQNRNVDGSSVTLVNCKFTGCVANNTNTTTTNGNGGGLYATARTLTINYDSVNNSAIVGAKGSFENCTAANAGGGLYHDYAGTVNIANCGFDGCTAKTTTGGGLYTTTHKLKIIGVDSKFKNCTAQTDGGGLYQNRNADGSSFTFSDGSFESCTATGNYGGAIYTPAKNVTLQSCTVKGSTAKAQGGGIWISPATKATFDGCTITGNTVTNSDSKGGGVYVGGGTTIYNSGTVSGCGAAYGGGWYQNNGNLYILGGSISGSATVDGGGLYVNKGTADPNVYQYGGAVGGTATGNGGGVYKNAGTYTLGNGTYNNTDYTDGASIGGLITLTATENGVETTTDVLSSATNGGGVYNNGGTFTLKTGGSIGGVTTNEAGDTVYTATASANGGGVYVGGGAFQINGGLITNCMASGNGGGIYYASTTSDLNFYADADSKIQNCRAANGGGVYLNNSANFNMRGGEIRSNSATTTGGGITHNKDKEVRIYFSGYCTVTDNTLNGGRCNVQLTKSSNAIINANGLDARSEICVYTANGTILENHGGSGDPFGTWSINDDKLFCFVNDRSRELWNLDLRGFQSTLEGNTNIYWEYHPLLTVFKEVNSDLASDQNTAEFKFIVTLKDPDGASVTLTQTQRNSIKGMIFNAQGIATFTLKNGGSQTGEFPNEFDRYRYEVKEDLSGDAQADYATAAKRNGEAYDFIEDKPLTVSGQLGENIGTENSSSLSTVAYTNTRNTDDLTIKAVTVSTEESDFEESFDYTLTLDDATISKAYPIGTEGTETLSFTNGVATFSLKHHESITIQGLPTDLTYTVEENLTDKQKTHVRTEVSLNGSPAVPDTKQAGVIGGAKTPEAPEAHEEVVFTNSFLEIVCKITNRSRALLYYRDAANKLQPAVFAHLEDAFDQVNSGNLRTAGGGQVSGQLRIEMVVPAYTMEKTATLISGKTVLLSTALITVEQYPYNDGKDDGAGNVSVVTRGYDGGSMIATEGALTIDKITLDGGSTADTVHTASENGGIVKVNGAVKLTVNSSATLRNSTTTDNGGGIWLGTGASLTMSGTILNCEAAAGGGVYANTGFTTIATTGTITACEATDGTGGAICASTGSSVNLNAGTTLTGNTSKGDGGAVWSAANVILRGTVGGTGENDGNTAGGNGGGVYMGSQSTLNLSGGEITNNRATGDNGNGGGVYAEGTVNFTGGTISANNAVDGAGVYLASTAIFDMSKTGTGTTVISNNIASRNGGGVYVNNGTLNMTATSEAPGMGPSIKNCTAILGGGIYETGSTASVKISGGEISGNTATGNGGGALRLEEYANAEISGTAQIKDNKVTGTEEDRWGGAVNIRRGHLTIAGGTISGNYVQTTNAKGHGGAITVGSDGSELIMKGGTISGNYVKTEGNGAIAYGGAISIDGSAYVGSNNTNSTVTISGGKIESNYVTAENGGVAFGGAISVLYKGHLTITGGTIGGNTAALANTATNGGAVYVAANATAEMTGGEIIGNSAKDGGGVYVIGNGAKLTVKGGNIRSNTATAVGDAGGLGGGVYVGNGTSLEMSGGTITANTANNANGGAINVGGENARLIFSGSPVVYDNPNATAGKQQKNVVLSVGDTKIIQSKGITGTYAAGAKIGVYVIDGEGDNRPIYNAHGIYDKPFGNFTVEGNLDVFRNDRNGALYGVKKDDNQIYWLNVVCKLTDSTGKLLYQDQYGHTPAVYATVKDGFEAAGKTLYSRSGSTYTENNNDALILKMLQDYELVKNDDIDEVIVYKTGRDITVTTAETGAVRGVTATWDEYFFKPAVGATGDSLTKATLKRGEGNTASMFTVNTAAANSFTVKDIILDGNKTTYSEVPVNGGIVNVTAGKLVVADGAVLRNSAVAGDNGNGGAVYVNANATAEMTGGEITGNEAVNGGAVYVVSGGTATLKDGTKTVSGTATPTSVTIAGNTVRTIAEGAATARVDVNKGAGIYLAEGARLNMEGSPSFVKDDATNSLTDTTNAYPGDPAKTNGQQEVYTDGKVRQDIYMKGYANVTSGDTTTETLATSIVVTGALDVANGSIWVWSSDPAHYKMLTQFAKFADSLIKNNKVEFPNVAAEKQSDALESTYLAFRNAQDDATTECGGDYLTGQEGDAKNLIKWTGGFDFVFKKIDGNGNALDGATFTLYKADDAGNPTDNAYRVMDKDHPGNKKEAAAKSQNIAERSAVTVKVLDGDAVKDVNVFGDGLVVFEKIPPGVYFLKETAFPTVSGKTVQYKAVEDMYMIELDGKGYYTIYVIGQDGDGNAAWVKDNKYKAPTETLSFGTGAAAYTVDVATALNILPMTRKVVLRKVEDKTSAARAYAPVPGAKFTVYYADKQTVVTLKHTPTTTEKLENLESLSTGAFWMGQLPCGTYYIEETITPAAYRAPTHFFKLEVTDSGVMTREISASSADPLP